MGTRNATRAGMCLRSQVSARAEISQTVGAASRLLAFLVTASVGGFLLDAWAVVPPQFGAATNFPAGGPPSSIIVGDFSHDGKADVAVTVGDNVNVLLSLGNGTLGPPTAYPLVHFSPGTMVLGDFNNDADLDIAVGNRMGGGARVLLSDGRGSFPGISNLMYSSYGSGVAAGDFNGDCNLDLAFGNLDAYIAVAFGRGDGSFGAATYYNLAGVSSPDVHAGDIYRNGRLALVVSTRSTNTFCVLSNKGDGTFAAPQYFYAAGASFRSLNLFELEDFNGDGALDLAGLSYDANSVAIWLNNGRGIFAPTYQYALGFPPTGFATGDFNGDGAIDIIVRGAAAAKLLLGNGDGSFTVAAAMSVPSDPRLAPNRVAMGDFNGDGAPDLAFPNAYSNSVVITLNETPPFLQLAPMPGYNQVSWPAAFGEDFTLEYTTNFLAPGNWQPFPYPPVWIGGQKAVTDWTDRGQKFYRLRKP